MAALDEIKEQSDISADILLVLNRKATSTGLFDEDYSGDYTGAEASCVFTACSHIPGSLCHLFHTHSLFSALFVVAALSGQRIRAARRAG